MPDTENAYRAQRGLPPRTYYGNPSEVWDAPGMLTWESDDDGSLTRRDEPYSLDFDVSQAQYDRDLKIAALNLDDLADKGESADFDSAFRTLVLHRLFVPDDGEYLEKYRDLHPDGVDSVDERTYLEYAQGSAAHDLT